MRSLAGDRALHENLLFLYFSDMKDMVLTEKMRIKINEFIDVFRANDKMDGTRTVDTAVEVYSKGVGASIQEIKRNTNLSDASLYRFRIKMADKLMAFLMASPTEDL